MRNIILNTNDIYLKEISPETTGLILAYIGDIPRFFIIYNGCEWIASMNINIIGYSYKSESLDTLVRILLRDEYITNLRLIEL